MELILQIGEKMEETKSKYQYVFSMRLAGQLMAMGYKLLRMDKHFRDKDKNVYVFEYSDEIHDVIEKHIKAKEK